MSATYIQVRTQCSLSVRPRCVMLLMYLSKSSMVWMYELVPLVSASLRRRLWKRKEAGLSLVFTRMEIFEPSRGGCSMMLQAQGESTFW